MHETDLTDAVLAIRCQLGNQDAWEDMVERWHPRLWKFLVRMLSDPAVAEDVLQTVWLKVVRSMGRLREPEHLPAWLYGIARRAAADRMREQYRQPAHQEFTDIGEEDRKLAVLEQRELIEAGLGQLHPTDREAVVLHYLEELPVADVAEICGVPPGTIKSRLHRARRIFRETLND